MSGPSGAFLTPPDEYFTHQVPFPHSVVGSSDPSWRERYWFSIQDIASKDVVLTCGLGQYPNQNTQEAFVSLATAGVQRNVRLARALLPDTHITRVGPFSVEVVRSLEALRLVLDTNPSGIEFDLLWSGTMAPLLEDRHYQLSRARVVHDLVRYVQVGRVAGRLRSPDGEYTVEETTWWGQRDHSWGLRPIPAMAGEPPTPSPEWRLLLFAPLQFETFGLHLYLFESRTGRPLHLSAGIMRPAGADHGDDDIIESVHHDLRWRDGALFPTLERGGLTITLLSGTKLDIELTAQPGRAFLRGGGYGGVDGWFQGHWKGEDSFEHDVWDLATAADDERRYWAKASSDHLVEARCNGQVGYGIVEYLVLPGHPSYPAPQ